jgi:2-oxoisovalerate dehydrogenase E1 component alpha subunit
MPTYRYINAEGVVVDTKSQLDIGKEKALKMYKDMVTTSVMDLIMCDQPAAQSYKY